MRRAGFKSIGCARALGLRQRVLRCALRWPAYAPARQCKAVMSWNLRLVPTGWAGKN